MEKKLNILNYEESLEILAEKIDFHSEMNEDQKKNALYGFVDYLARQ